MFKWAMVLLMAVLFTGCISQKKPDTDIGDYIKENPEALISFLEEHKVKLLEIVETAGQQREMDRFLGQIKANLGQDRLVPDIQEGRLVLGRKDAATTIVVYSDFLCSYCSQGDQRIQDLLTQNGDKLKVVIKHLPLQGENSMVAAVYIEALGRMDPEKATQLYHKLFAHQEELASDVSYLFNQLVALKVDMPQLQALAQSEEIQGLIVADKEEALLFEITGTPTFVVNGVKITGAVPLEWFQEAIKVIERHDGLKDAVVQQEKASEETVN